MTSAYVSDARLLVVVAAALTSLLLYLAVTTAVHRRRLASIPIRVHVAGTRGKSTTTRLIAAGLRAGGLRVMAKTTGTRPRLIHRDGSETPWPRRGPPSIREQARFVALAARERCDAIVVECMAIRPELVWASEYLFVRSTASVVTNVRPDHLEELGGHPDAVAASLSGMVSRTSLLFLTDESAAPAIVARATRLGAERRTVSTRSLAPFEANRVLAVDVCEALGVRSAVAAEAMDAAERDPGAFSVTRLAVLGKPIRFANAFSCNDVASLELLWDHVHAAAPRATVVLLNVRDDRPVRTRQFLAFVARRAAHATLFLASDRRRSGALLGRLAQRAGFAADRVRHVASGDARTVLRQLAAVAEPESTIWGLGNYRGLGEAIADLVTAEAQSC